MVVAANAGKSSVPSGWYPDPNNSSINRWWSGSEWTKDVSPREVATEVARNTDDALRAATARAENATRAAATRASSIADENRGQRASSSSIAARTAATRPAAARPASSTTPNSAASYAASSARPSSPAAPFRDPARGRPAPEIMQPPYAFNRTMSTFALIGVIVGLGLIAGLLLN